MPSFSNSMLALLGGAILLVVGLVRRKKNGKVDFIYVFFGAVLIIIGITRIGMP